MREREGERARARVRERVCINICVCVLERAHASVYLLYTAISLISDALKRIDANEHFLMDIQGAAHAIVEPLEFVRIHMFEFFHVVLHLLAKTLRNFDQTRVVGDPCLRPCVCVCMWMDVCVCVCVCERERERERECVCVCVCA